MGGYDTAKAIEMADSRAAVVEAAKAWHRWQWKDLQRSAYAPEGFDERLAQAIEALIELEKGEE